MKFLQRLNCVLNTLKTTVNNYNFKLSARMSPKDFSRERKMNFQDVLLCLLNHFRKNAQIEIDDFFEIVKESEIKMTEQAFLKARNKISPVAFTKLNDLLAQDIYSKEDYYKKFHGYRLLAIDGTTITLNNTETMRNIFGYSQNLTNKFAKAQASCLYDVENKVVLDSLITKYKADERKLALEHIVKLKQIGLCNDLILFDRGYPSKEILTELINNGISFVIRVCSQFIKEVNESNEEDEIVQIKLNKESKRLRVINAVLKTGEVEKLITNVFDESFSANDFKELYFKRWCIETRYDFLKNKLEIENFTGTSELTVLQDFYASIYLSNLYEMVKAVSDEEIQKDNEGKVLKHKYQTNQKRLISKLKNNFIKIVIEEESYKKQQMLNALIEEIKRYSLPIKPNRSYPRKRSIESIKFPKNQKRS